MPIELSLPQIWVENPGDAARAREIIDAYLRTNVSGPTLLCENCGEENPASFEVCWNCGAGLSPKA